MLACYYQLDLYQGLESVLFVKRDAETQDCGYNFLVIFLPFAWTNKPMPNVFQRIFNFRNKSDSEIAPGGEQMTEIQQRIQRAAESILENEALTADLDDDAAKALLDWGVKQAQAIASETIEMDDAQAEEVMYQPMRALRKMLRTANKWAVDPQEMTLARIMKQAEIIYGNCPTEEQQAAFLMAIPQDTTARVHALRGFVEGDRRDPYRN